ncbi:MAG: hypothetical protein JWQ40_1601 [Segetibacter sp.]|nr:hypothetical protein [Segetibacter sp.]
MELFLQWLEGRPKYPAIKPAVHVVMLCGSVTAVASCITGYLLSLSENYGARLVNWQM